MHTIPNEHARDPRADMDVLEPEPEPERDPRWLLVFLAGALVVWALAIYGAVRLIFG